ncbi:MAG TPA: sugar ABC transporter permease [Acidimicrobiales bacterium]|nr:sugar ABC transporter permease [Acidimicrobiales bacterium]
MTTLSSSVPQLPVDRAVPAANGQPRPSAVRAQAWKRRLPLMPAFVYVVIVTQVPFLVTLWYSFRRWNLLVPGSNKFAGLAEYRAAFADPAFRQAAVRTVEMTASAVILSMVLGSALALLVNRKFFGRGIVRTMLITPFLIMPVATDLLFKTTIYDPIFGFLDFVLKPFGVGRINWLGTHAVGSIVVVLVWEWAPFMMLIVLAGLQGEDLEALEAARVDGANALKSFAYITLPNIQRYIQLGVLLGSIYIVQTFGEVFVLTAGGPGTATTNLPYYLYEQVFDNFTVGLGAAAGIIVVILTQVVAIFALRLLSGLLRASTA